MFVAFSLSNTRARPSSRAFSSPGLLLFSLLTAPGLCSAESASIIVNASRTTASAPVLTLDAQALEQGAPPSLVEPLDSLPGVRAYSKGGIGGGSYVSLRGGEPNFTLILLDGVRLNDPTNSQGGAFDAFQLDPAALENIHIVPGALSAVHGSDALSGLVSLELRRAAVNEKTLTARSQIDSAGALGASVTGTTGWSDGSLLLSLSGFDGGNLSPDTQAQRWQALGRGEQQVGAVQLGALGLYANTRRRLYPEDSGGERLAASNALETRDTQMTVASLWAKAAEPGAIRPQVQLNWTQQTADIDTPAIAPGVLDGVPAILADTRFDRLEATADLTADLTDWATAAIGTVYNRETGRGRGSVDFGFLIPADFDLERTTVSGFGEVTLHGPLGLEVTLGSRYDDPDTGAAQWSTRTSAVLAPWGFDGPRLLASYAEGFKLPSLYALAYPLIANPNLRPERTKSWDASVQTPLGDRLNVSLGYFHTIATDLIDFDPALFTNVNRARVVMQGVEARMDVQLMPTLTANAALTHLDIDATTGTPPLRSRPRWRAAGGLIWTPDTQWQVHLTGKTQSSEFDSSIPTGLIRRNGYALADASVLWQQNPQWQWQMSLLNFTDTDYENSVGTPALGRTLRFSLRFTPTATR